MIEEGLINNLLIFGIIFYTFWFYVVLPLLLFTETGQKIGIAFINYVSKKTNQEL